MVQLSSSFITFVALAASGVVLAHPHARSGSELEFHNGARRSLADCQNQLRRRGGIVDRSVARRQVLAERIRKERGLPAHPTYLKRRDLASVLATDHASNLTGLTAESDPSLLFTGNSSCVLGPEVTEGPYYVQGEYIRSDVREDQDGVPLYVDVELIDVNTCEPVPNLYMDFWHANATGVYSGVVANGNGDSSVTANLNTTFLRGVQQTDENGVAQFISVFPGHYTGRAEHIHIVVHQTDGVLSTNGTYSGLNVAHVGQLFLDQDLISTVNAVEPYASNTLSRTLNSEDMWLAAEADDIDPMLEYVFLGANITDGILAWTAMGIDTNLTHTISPASTLTEDGGVANPGSVVGGGQGGSPPSGSGAPSGAMPSGTGAPSGSSAAPTSSAT